jgi:hypothetical protein
VFPKDLPSNQCDRIHAYILWIGERKYGRNFWPDYFKEIRKEYTILRNAVKLGNSNKIRNKRYQVAVDCFDRLKGLDFKSMLKKAKISLTTDVKALNPENPEWDRRFTSSDPVNNVVYDIHSVPQNRPVVDTNILPPLHKAAYGGHDGEMKKLIQEGAA